MKNWKSTLLGAALAGADVLVTCLSVDGFDVADWKSYLRPVLLAALGFVVADAKKSV
jgi:hypothetical protein